MANVETRLFRYFVAQEQYFAAPPPTWKSVGPRPAWNRLRAAPWSSSCGITANRA